MNSYKFQKINKVNDIIQQNLVCTEWNIKTRQFLITFIKIYITTNYEQLVIPVFMLIDHDKYFNIIKYGQ